MRFLIISGCFWIIASTLLSAQTLPADSIKRAINAYIAQKVDSIVKHKLDSLLPPPKVVIAKPLNRTFKYNVALTGSLNEGNINRKLLAFRSEFSWSGKLLEFDLHPRFAFGEQNGQLAEREPYIDALLNVFHKSKFYGFLATNMEASNLRGITFRWLGGVGVGWHILSNKQVKISLTNLLLYETTDFISRTDILLWRNSTRLKGEYHLFKNRLTFKHWLYFQPSFSSKNYRWNGIFSLEFPIYKSLQFRCNFEDIYESVVPTNRRNEDRTLSFGLSFGVK